MTEPTTDLESRIETLLAVQAVERERATSIETQLAADRAALAESEARRLAERATYQAQARAWALDASTRRPNPPADTRVRELREDVELRAAAAQSVRTELARLDAELAQLLAQRVHLEHDALARAFAADLPETGLGALVGFLLGGAAPQRTAAEQLERLGVLVRVDPSSVTITIPRPKADPHHEDVLARSISSRRTPRLAAMLADRAQARAEAAEAAERTAIEDHAGKIALQRGELLARLDEVQRTAERSGDFRGLAEIERETAARLSELHRSDVEHRRSRGWSEPSWAPEFETRAPHHPACGLRPQSPAPQPPAPGWA